MTLRVILGLLLAAIPVGVLYVFDRRLLRTFLVSTVRMVLQLLVLCLMVWVLVRYDRWWLSVLWLAAMAGWGTFMTARRKRLPSRLLPAVGLGGFGGTLLVGFYLLFVVLPLRIGMDARWFVPVMALLLGHTLTMTVNGLSAYVSAVEEGGPQYEFLRGNGASHLKAVMPLVRRAFQAVLAPTAASLSELGLYTMPLLLCGIFLGGVQPVNVFVVSVMLILGCVASSVVALALALWLSDRKKLKI